MGSPIHDTSFSLRALMRSFPFKLFTLALIASGLSLPSCAQKRMVEVSDSNEVSVTFSHVAKPGTTKRFLIEFGNIPSAPNIPPPYQQLGNKSYKVVSGTIDLGDPIVSFKVPVNDEEEFRQVRVLRLVANELGSPAFQWKNCTMSLESVQALEASSTNPDYLRYLQAYKKENSKYFPNFSSRQVSCEIDDGLKVDEYFTVVRQLDATPTKGAQ